MTGEATSHDDGHEQQGSILLHILPLSCKLGTEAGGTGPRKVRGMNVDAVVERLTARANRYRSLAEYASRADSRRLARERARTLDEAIRIVQEVEREEA